MGDASTATTIGNVQALRAFAAIAVVLGHTFFLPPQFRFFEGVPLFFVISGFIMTYISRGGAPDFMRNRIVRIVPLYWVATLAYLLMLIFTGGTGILGQHALGILQSLLFIPYNDTPTTMFPFLGPGWTLNLEMYFYAVFAVALVFSNRWAPLVAALVIGGVFLLAHTPGLPSRLAFYGHEEIAFFIYGIGAYYLWAAVPVDVFIRFRRWVVAAGLAIGCAYIALPFLQPTSPLYTLFGPPALVLAALSLHKAGVRLRTTGVLVFLGNASYAIYLCQYFVLNNMWTVRSIWPAIDQATNGWVAAASTGLAVLLGIFVHLKVEKPLTIWARQRFKRTASAHAVTSP